MRACQMVFHQIFWAHFIERDLPNQVKKLDFYLIAW